MNFTQRTSTPTQQGLVWWQTLVTASVTAFVAGGVVLYTSTKQIENQSEQLREQASTRAYYSKSSFKAAETS